MFKRNSRFFFYVICCAIPLQTAISAEPPLPKTVENILDLLDSDLAKAKQKYYLAIEKAQRKAKTSLKLEGKKLARKGEVEAALSVSEKILQIENFSVNELLGSDLNKTISNLLLPTVEVTIPGDSRGQLIGTFKAGQKISIRYVSGKWGFAGSMGSRVSSPDDTGTRTPTELIFPDGRRIAVPTNTRTKPFEIPIVQSGAYKLRMDDLKPQGNPGEVIYSVTILK